MNPNPEERKRMVDDALKDFYPKHANPAPTPDQQVILRGASLAQQVGNQMHQVLTAARSQGHPFNQEMAFQTAFNLLEPEFAKWSKDDLVYLAAVMHASIIGEKAKEGNNQGIY